jgi:hypothetical protein
MNGRDMSEPHQTETTRDSLRKHAIFTAAALAAAFCCPPGVRAQADQPRIVLAQSSLGCETDLKAMQDRRMALISEFNQMAKSHGGKLDPVESCPKLKTLAAVESTFKTYMVKNKDWCNVPDDAITNVTESQAKTAALATRVCNVAEQVKKQQATGGPAGPAPPKLPAGPL